MPILIFLSKYLEYKSSDMAIVCDFLLHRSSYNLVSSSGKWSILPPRNIICFFPAEGVVAVLFHWKFFFSFHFPLMLLRVFKFSRSLNMIFFHHRKARTIYLLWDGKFLCSVWMMQCLCISYK